MFTVNDDLSIYVTRGDTLFFSVAAENNDMPYMFRTGEVVRIKVFEKKACENVVLQKDFPVLSDTEKVDIFLTEQDTRFGEIISKPADYWYEVELNPFSDPQTIIGYDEDGAKVLRLFPEGADLEVVEPDEEDIPVVDEELDMTSTRPVQNQAVTRAIIELSGDTDRRLLPIEEALSVIGETIYPVGSIYLSMNSANPGTLFGGTWERLTDRFLLGAGDTYAAGATGGSAIHILTEEELPSHTHEYLSMLNDGTGTEPEGETLLRSFDASSDIGTRTVQYTGDGRAHNNMPPYLAVYMWRRTA